MINLFLHMMESEALKNLFLKLVNMSISASWIVLVVLILRLVLRKAPKWVNVLLWGIVAVRLICPFSIESVLSLIPSVETIPMNIEMDTTPAIDSGVTAVNSVVNPIISASFTPHPGASANPLQIWIPLTAVIWFLGMILMLLYTAISYWRLRRKVDTAVRLKDNIYQSENVGSPFVLGILKPRIYLPYSMDGKNLDHVVAHEQAHIHRKDHWWKPLGFLLLTVYWFNPLMWVAYILLCRDIELACDEKVIAELGNEQRADYTQALVACSVNRRMIAACPLAFGEVSVKDRVKSIMNYRKPSFWITMTALLACGIASICFLTNPIGDERNSSFLNYKNAISLSAGQDVIPAVHYSSQNEHGSIGIGMVEGDAFARFLGSVGWTEKWMEPSDLSSPGSVAVNVADNLRIKVYDRNFAAVEFNDEVCYYRINNSDYEKIMELLMPADEERLEKSSETRLDIVFGVATIEKSSDSISLGVFFSDKEYDDITEFKLQNLHNGSWSFITDEEVINSVLQFLSKVEGINKISSKGYYGGCYAIQAQNGNEIVFSIAFGDDESFNYGDYGDGYPARYELDGITKEEIIRFFSHYDSSDFDWGLDNENRLSDHPLVAYISSEWAVDSKADNIELPFKKLMINDDGSGVIDGTKVTWKICDEFTSNQSIHIKVYTDSELIVSVVYWSKSQLLQIVDENGNLLECYYHRIAYPTAEGTDMELMIDPIVPVTVVDQITGEMKFVNSNQSIRAIQSLISSEWWAEGNPACDYDFKITVNEADFMYHSDCGTFTDILGDRCITLDETQQEAMDILLSEANDVLDRYWLTIGADGVKSIEIKTAHSSGGCEHSDGSLYKKGERIWLECLDGYTDLRGVSFTALGEDGQIIWQASVPDGEDNEGFTHLRNDDWNITNTP